MKAGWQIKSLGEVATIGAGNSAPQGDDLFIGGEHQFFRTSDAGKIRFGDIYEATDKLNDKGVKGLRLFPKGTILFPKSGASTFLNHRVMLGVDGYVSSHLATIVADTSQVHERFLLYFLTTVFAQDLVQDHAYPSLNLPIISGIKLPCPTLSEQQRIVTILDKVFEEIGAAEINADKNQANAREVFESTLQALIARGSKGAEIRQLGDTTLLEMIDGDRGANYPKSSDFLSSGHCLFLNTKNVRPDGFNFDTTMFISQEKDSQLRKGKLMRGDIVMTTRGTIGNIGYYSDDIPYDHIRMNSGMLIFRPNKSSLLPTFLFELLRSEIVKSQIRKQVTGAAQPQLPIKTLVNFSIPVPGDIEVQRAVVERLRSLEQETLSLEAIYKQKLASLSELKKSILNQAFTGQLQ